MVIFHSYVSLPEGISQKRIASDVRKFAFLILGGAIAFSGFYGFFLDPGAQP